MTDTDWDLIHRVHVRGTYKCTKAAWDIMRNQNYGRCAPRPTPVALAQCVFTRPAYPPPRLTCACATTTVNPLTGLAA